MAARAVARRIVGSGRGAFGAEAINASLDIKTFAFDRYVADGEHVVALGNWSGVVRKTGKSYDARLALYFQVRESKFLRFTGYEDTAILAAAARE